MNRDRSNVTRIKLCKMHKYNLKSSLKTKNFVSIIYKYPDTTPLINIIVNHSRNFFFLRKVNIDHFIRHFNNRHELINCIKVIGNN